MSFVDRMKDLFNQGVHVSRDFVTKAGEKAQDLGEKGVLKLEVMQLEGQAQKLIGKLGSELYSLLEEKGQKTVSRETPGIRELVDEINSVKAAVETRNRELQAAKQGAATENGEPKDE